MTGKPPGLIVRGAPHWLAGALALASLAACASPGSSGNALHGAAGLLSTATPARLKSGEEAWLIACEGAANSINTCVARANLLCPGGYKPHDLFDAAVAPNPRALLVSCLR